MTGTSYQVPASWQFLAGIMDQFPTGADPLSHPVPEVPEDGETSLEKFIDLCKEWEQENLSNPGYVKLWWLVGEHSSVNYSDCELRLKNVSTKTSFYRQV